MGQPYSRQDRLFDLKAYVSDAIEDLIKAARACDNEAAKSDLTDEVMVLFETSSALCRAMRQFALAERDRPLTDGGISSPARLCSGDAPP